MKQQAVAAAANGVVLLAPQIIGLLMLRAAEYGAFSLVYLVYAFGTSLSLSMVLEAWSRSKVLEGVVGEWRGFASVLLLIAGAAAIVSVVVASFAGISPLGTALSCVAVALAVYRFGARYHEVQVGRLRRSFAADVAAMAAMALVLGACLTVGVGGTEVVLGTWAAGQLVSTAVGTLPPVPRASEVRGWFASHGTSMRPLVKDSILMDASAIGTPYILAGLLGVAGLGVYRAVSSISAPVRLLLTAIRPMLSRAAPERLRRPASLLVVLGVSVVSGAGAYVAILVIDRLGELGVINQLAPFALPTALFVGANFLGQFYAISMRIHGASARTLGARIAHSGLAVVLPLVGAVVWGLPGAIWGYSAATVVAGGIWMLQALRR